MPPQADICSEMQLEMHYLIESYKLCDKLFQCSKSLSVRTLRMNDFLLILKGNDIVDVAVEKLPEVIFVDGVKCKAVSSLGDYCLLKNDAGQLVGFSFDIAGNEKILNSSFVRRSRNSFLGERQLRIFLAPAPSFEEDPVLGATWVYQNGNKFAVGIFNWGDWGAVAFPISRTDNLEV